MEPDCAAIDYGVEIKRELWLKEATISGFIFELKLNFWLMLGMEINFV